MGCYECGRPTLVASGTTLVAMGVVHWLLWVYTILVVMGYIGCYTGTMGMVHWLLRVCIIHWLLWVRYITWDDNNY